MVDRRRTIWLNRVGNRVFKAWFRVRKGNVAIRGASTGILHTTGATTGRARETPLLYLDVGDGTYALVGSNGGDDRTPAWVRNLIANPRVEFEAGSARRPMAASIASSERRAELWPRLVDMYASYESYQRKTSRLIPVIVLQPLPGA